MHDSHGISLSAGMVLGAVVHAGRGGITLGAIARRCGVSASSTSRMVAHLEHSRLVRRLSSSGDRRLHTVEATTDGIERWEAFSRTVEEEMHRFFTTRTFAPEYRGVVARLCRP
ncbi:MarR family transcriptional regulator [Streptomyces sp. NPDC006184]|uniref:MarR family transcriptional regulator n=1 Tax=Streptomyces sp. NPDC006184 TaxID=3155455 RepID=UPI0033B6183B